VFTKKVQLLWFVLSVPANEKSAQRAEKF
jgi:hypothetical protein